MKAGWRTTTIGAISTIESGSGFPLQYQGKLEEQIPFYKVGDMNLAGNEEAMCVHNNSISSETQRALKSQIFPVGAIILPKIGGAIATNKKRVVSRTCCVDNNIMGIIPKADELDSCFMYCFLLQHDLSEFANDAGLPSIRKSVVESWAISIPSSLKEQKRIVAILDESFDGIATAKANAENNLQNARELLGSYLASAFMNGGKGWVKKSLEDTVDGACSLSYGIVQPGDEWSDGLPVVRPTDLTTKLIEIEGLKRIDPTLADSYRRTTLRGGDILLCVRGSTGTVSVASITLAGANVTRGIVPIFFEQSMVSQDFGYYLMRCEPVQSQIREKTYGAALMQINIRDLRLIKLLVPPLREQKELAAKFDELALETQRLESLYQQKLTALVELKKSLLHEAFSGKL